MSAHSRKNTREEAEPSFQIRPAFEHKFRAGAVKEVIHAVLNDVLAGKAYEGELVTEWCQKISDGIKSRVKDLGYDRYKVRMFSVGRFYFLFFCQSGLASRENGRDAYFLHNFIAGG